MIGPSVRKRLHATYEEQWGEAWPYDDKYLDELWREAIESIGSSKAKPNLPELYDLTLSLMRETHELVEKVTEE